MTPNDELSRLLAAERGVRAPADAAERGLERLLTDLVGPAAALPVATGALNLGWSLLSKSVLVGFVVGTAGAFTAAQVWSPASASETISETRPALAAPSSSTAFRSPPQLEPGRVEVPPPASPVSSTSNPRSSTSNAQPLALAPSAPTATFDEELQLITLAKRELDSGRRAQARAHLLEHARLFPAGVFAVDREALEILTQCTGGNQSQRALRDFAARHPGSPMINRLERACGSSGSAEKPGSGAFPEIVK